MKKRTLIKHILKSENPSGESTVAGWVRSVRQSKHFSFLVLNDGSCQEGLQIILDEDLPEYAMASSLKTGACVRISGDLRPSQGKGQTVEMQAKRMILVGAVGEDYPLQKKILKTGVSERACPFAPSHQPLRRHLPHQTSTLHGHPSILRPTRLLLSAHSHHYRHRCGGSGRDVYGNRLRLEKFIRKI